MVKISDVQDAMLAGWRAKQKTAEIRKARGFTPKPGNVSSGRAGTSSAVSATPSRADPRKAKSRCADCKQEGYWKGDPECPLVQAGKTPRFVPETPKNNYMAINWVGMVQKVKKEDNKVDLRQ